MEVLSKCGLMKRTPRDCIEAAIKGNHVNVLPAAIRYLRGWKQLHWLSDQDDSVVWLAVLHQKEDALRFLVKTEKLSVEETSRTAGTPLSQACRHGAARMVEVLLELGANVNRAAPLYHTLNAGHGEVINIMKLLCTYIASHARYSKLFLSFQKKNTTIIIQCNMAPTSTWESP